MKQQNKQNIDTVNSQTPSIKQDIGGLGLERTKNLIMTQLNEQNEIISGSFSDLQSLKDNAHQMVKLSPNNK